MDGCPADSQLGNRLAASAWILRIQAVLTFYRQKWISPSWANGPLNQDLQDVERDFYQATENYVFTHNRHLPVSNYQPVAEIWTLFAKIDKRAKMSL